MALEKNKVLEFDYSKHRNRNRRKSFKPKIELYELATELYSELDSRGIIDRTKDVAQLGNIKVNTRFNKSRYDYIVLQLYLHSFIKKHINTQLKFSYNNKIKKSCFLSHDNNFDGKISIYDVLQILAIIYNIGHFKNTFTASKAMMMKAKEDNVYRSYIENGLNSKEAKECLDILLSTENYKRIHLINSFFILEKCNHELKSVKIAKNILYTYIKDSCLDNESSMHFAFDIFRKIRTLAFVVYDLQASAAPFNIDITDERAMKILLIEMLAEYNNSQHVINVLNGMTKMLSDIVYNEKTREIIDYRITRRMCRIISKRSINTQGDYFEEEFLSGSSPYNIKYKRNIDFITENILKITFSHNENSEFRILLDRLERMNNIRFGFYRRYSSSNTVLISIRKSCDKKTKIRIAYKLCRLITNLLRNIPGISSYDYRFMLCSKFLLYFLFNENIVSIKPTLDSEKCLFCTRGKNSRMHEIECLIKNSCVSDDQRHETEVMLECLKSDLKNDVSICIPASIILNDKNNPGVKLAEFDGMIIHPNRDIYQITFIEAKNIKGSPSTAKKCLIEKFNKFNVECDIEKIQTVSRDAIYKYTI